MIALGSPTSYYLPRESTHLDSIVRVLCSLGAKCGLNSRTGNVVDFKFRAYINPIIANDGDKEVRLGNVEYEVVAQFCYFGDMLSKFIIP